MILEDTVAAEPEFEDQCLAPFSHNHEVLNTQSDLSTEGSLGEDILPVLQ
jgi:hypothetical protein